LLRTNGDLWQMHSHVKVIPTNGVVSAQHEVVMGAGVALQAKKRMPQLPFMIGRRIEKFGNNVHIIQVPDNLRETMKCSVLVAFPTKFHWQDKSTLWLVEKSCKQLCQAYEQNWWDSILLPEVGMGLGGLSPEEVYPLLDLYFNDDFMVVKFGKTDG
jgi:hypothetical protein